MNILLFAQTTPIDGVKEAGEKVAEVGKEMSGKVVGAGQETWDKVVSQITELVGGYAPSAAAALIVLIVGWIAALLIAAIVRAAVRRFRLHERLAPAEPGVEAW
jgi:hypothetical protein